MSEPKAVAEAIEPVSPGIWRWHVWDERIDFESDAYALQGPDGTVLIDPLPLAPEPLERLGRIVAICLTAACHQRSAWRYRKQFGVRVYGPEGTRATDEEPDVRYSAGQDLPGGLVAVHTPGPEGAHYALLRKAPPGVLFCADLVMRPGKRALAFVPPEYHDDPTATRRSVRSLLDLDFSILCLAHGKPITRDPHHALRRLLERDPGRRS